MYRDYAETIGRSAIRKDFRLRKFGQYAMMSNAACRIFWAVKG